MTTATTTTSTIPLIITTTITIMTIIMTTSIGITIISTTGASCLREHSQHLGQIQHGQFVMVHAHACVLAVTAATLRGKL